uniref:Uncharacterized protein n=1 Tax=Arundo donax TaxID=35708 RepID=A0A0A9FCR2_ARUDO
MLEPTPQRSCGFPC